MRKFRIIVETLDFVKGEAVKSYLESLPVFENNERVVRVIEIEEIKK